MPMRSLVGRWTLLALLVLGVVCMHHAPVAHAIAHAPASAVVSAGHQDHAMKQDVLAVNVAAATNVAVGDVYADGHAMLHLCLAILVAAATLLAVLGLGLRRPSAAIQVRRLQAGIGRFPPPVPVPRRLAALCVFRL